MIISKVRLYKFFHNGSRCTQILVDLQLLLFPSIREDIKNKPGCTIANYKTLDSKPIPLLWIVLFEGKPPLEQEQAFINTEILVRIEALGVLLV